MPIRLIDKIKQQNDGTFYLVDAVDVEYNGKSIIDALKAGDIITVGGEGGPTFHVANINIGSSTPFDAAALTPQAVKAGDLIVDSHGDFYTVTKVDGTTVTPSAALTGEDGILSFKGPKGDKGDPGSKGDPGVQGPKGDAFTIAKTYASVDEMNKDYANADIPLGSFVIISTADVDDVDNAKMFIKSTEQYTFVTDLSGAQGIQGPAGPQGAPGAAGTPGAKGDKGDPGVQGVKGDTGQRGTRTTIGQGAPGTPPDDAIEGDMYLDSTTGDLYQIQEQ